MPSIEMEELIKCFVDTLSPLMIYLFGSYANGSYNEDSDFDFYIVVPDEVKDPLEVMSKAYKAIRKIKKHPVDIIVGKITHFEEAKNRVTIENEVYRNGVLLYAA